MTVKGWRIFSPTQCSDCAGPMYPCCDEPLGEGTMACFGNGGALLCVHDGSMLYFVCSMWSPFPLMSILSSTLFSSLPFSELHFQLDKLSLCAPLQHSWRGVLFACSCPIPWGPSTSFFHERLLSWSFSNPMPIIHVLAVPLCPVICIFFVFSVGRICDWSCLFEVPWLIRSSYTFTTPPCMLPVFQTGWS